MRKETNLVLVMAAIFTATFMTSVETTIITTALPTIIGDLHGISLQSWVFAVYLLTTAITTPIYGKMADTIGRKPIILWGLALFTLGSFLCGFSVNMLFLIISRVVQGIGAGAVMSLTFTIIADLFSYEKRANILALNNTAWGISALAGPMIGGFIVDSLNWHWIFFINVPLGIIVFLLLVFGYHEDKRHAKTMQLDIGGTITLSVTLISILLVFQGFGSSHVQLFNEAGLILLAVIAATTFYYLEKKAIDPIIPFQMFSNRTFTVQILVALLLSGAQISFQIYFPIWLQSIYKLPAAIAGLAITPSPVMWLVSSFFVAYLLKRWAPKYVIGSVVCFQIIAYVPLVISGVNFPVSAFYIIAGVTGAALGIAITTNTVIAQRLAPSGNIGVASSMITLGRTLGQAIMTGVYGLVFNLSINTQLPQFKNVKLSDVNNFVNANNQQGINEAKRHALNTLILSSMHNIFYIVLILFAVTVVVNFYDKQKLAIK